MSPVVRSRRRNPRGSGARLREEIVRGATDLLVETGSESAVTLRAVARRVGIAAPSIYAHFDSPEQIVTAVVADVFDVLRARIEAARDTASTPRDQLIAGCRAYVAFGAEQPALYGLLFTRDRMPRGGSTPPGPIDVADLDGAGPFGLLMQSVQQNIEVGTSRAQSALDTAVQIWVAMHGLVLLRANEPGFPWPDPERTEIDLVTRLGQLTD